MLQGLIAVALMAAVPNGTDLSVRFAAVVAQSAAHYRALDAAASQLMRDEHGEMYVPRGFFCGSRKLDMRKNTEWTAGHYAGALWYLYEATGEGFFRDRAQVWTEILAENAKVTSHHDVGFIVNCSYGNARRLLKTDKFDSILKVCANSLSARFSPELGLIRSWGAITDTKRFLVIPDNLMNLELLELAAKVSGDSHFDKVARSHADVTMHHHFRADGGAYHVLNYDQVTLRLRSVDRGQGASCESVWSRGQSWAIYGYTMMFRETKDPAYLAIAQKTADYAMTHSNMPADGIPFWDYGAPGEERDSSAGAIMASALLELSTFVPEEKASAYRAFAVKQLISLSSSAYFSEGDEIGHFLLKHGVGAKPNGSEVDTPLVYGDYYFLEALLRFRNLM